MVCNYQLIYCNGLEIQLTSGHEDEGVVAQQGGVDGIQLVVAELLEAKHLGEHDVTE